MSVGRRYPSTALIAEVCCDETKGAGELFVCTTSVADCAVDSHFLSSEMTCELTLRADQLAER